MKIEKFGGICVKCKKTGEGVIEAVWRIESEKCPAISKGAHYVASRINGSGSSMTEPFSTLTTWSVLELEFHYRLSTPYTPCPQSVEG